MRYLSVCSGIEAATVAWHPLGWTAVGFAEIDKFASAVLAERFGSNLPGEPLTANGVPNHGDFTAIDIASLASPIDLLVGGTPCQAFSFAGKRLSLADARGNLTLAYAVLAHELARSHGLKNALWENVPGVLSTDDNAFGCFLGALIGADDAVPLPPGVERWPDEGMVEGPRARAAWRLLDAQYFGLAQRRERVFVVVDFGNGADPAAVLFEPQGVQGNSPLRREAGERPAGTVSARTQGGGGLGTDFECDGGLIPFGGNNCAGPIDVSTALNAHGGPAGRQDFESETFVVGADMRNGTLSDVGHTLQGGGAGEDRGLSVNCVPHVALHVGQVPAVTYPIDMRKASRGEKMTNNRKEGSTGGAPGTGIGEDGDPAHTIGTSHVPAVAYAIQAGALRENPDSGPDGIGVQSDHAYTLEARAEVQAVVFQPRFARNDRGAPDTIASALTGEAGRTGKGDSAQCVAYKNNGWAVRRLTTVECARLQGFPDHHARIPWRGKPSEECPDGPQYKTFGNSMAVRCMAWLGQRIERFSNSIHRLT